MIRILLADDHALVRAGIRSLIPAIEGAEVIAEACNGADAVALFDIHLPDVVLMDIAMDTMNGLEATAEIRRRHPAARVIILSMYVNEGYVEQALRAGACGYLLKDTESEEIGRALHAAMRGEVFLSPRVSTQLVESYLRRGADAPAEAAAAAPRRDVQLSGRQREVLQFIAGGLTTREIGQQLGISHKTVEVHRMQLMNRLDIHDIPGLVRYAIRIGLAPLNQ